MPGLVCMYSVEGEDHIELRLRATAFHSTPKKKQDGRPSVISSIDPPGLTPDVHEMTLAPGISQSVYKNSLSPPSSMP